MSETKETNVRAARIFAGKRLRYILGYALFFAVCMSVLKILDVYWDTGELAAPARIAFTFGFWLLGGGVIGYVTWISRNRCWLTTNSDPNRATSRVEE